MNASELIARAKVRAALPKTLNYTDQAILDLINEELSSELVPLLLGAKGNLLDAKVDLQLVAGQTEYPIPTRAVLSKVRLLTYVAADGTESKPLKQVEQADIHQFAATGVPTGFYFTQAGIATLPTSADGVGQIRVRFPRRPSDLVLAALVATVVSATDTVLTVDATPAGIVTGKKVDIGQALSPFKPLGDDLAVTATDATHITIGAGGLAALGILAGDFVTLQRTGFVPTMPQEWHTVLLLRATARLQHDARDVAARNATLQLVKEKEKTLGAVQDARADGNPKRINAWRGHRRRWSWR